MVVSWLPLLLALVAQSPAPQPVAEAPAHPGLERIVVDTETQRAEWSTRLTRMVRIGALRLREQRGTPPAPRDQWYLQLHKGVPVEGGEVWRRVEGTTLVAAEGTIYNDIRVDPVPRLTRKEILEAIAALEPGRLGPSRPPDLVVLPTADGGFALAYRARVFAGTTLTTYYLDASNGAVILKQEAASMPPPA
jgi:hypothetical protein